MNKCSKWVAEMILKFVKLNSSRLTRSEMLGVWLCVLTVIGRTSKPDQKVQS